MANILGSKRDKYKIKKINKGWFKSQGAITVGSCLVCKKEFNFYKSVKTKKYCSTDCYHLACRGRKRPGHSEFMKIYSVQHNTGDRLKGRVQSEQERENTSERMRCRWRDKNDKLNSRENRQRISDLNMKLAKEGRGISTYNKGYARGRQGTYNINGKEMFFRSLWEVNYAIYLDFLIKQGAIQKWEFEVDTFWFEEIRRGVRSYKPDFKIFKNDGSFEYHEVKGYMDKKSATKLKRMKKYYPKIKMILIDQEYYRDLRRKLGKMLGFYE